MDYSQFVVVVVVTVIICHETSHYVTLLVEMEMKEGCYLPLFPFVIL